MSVTITRNPNLSKSGTQKSLEHLIKKEFGENWWTGLAPKDCPGFDQERNCLVALPKRLLRVDESISGFRS